MYRRTYKRRPKTPDGPAPDHKTAAAGLVQRLRALGWTPDAEKLRRLEKTLADSMGVGMVQRPRGKTAQLLRSKQRKDS
jgi:hypothetical protein